MERTTRHQYFVAILVTVAAAAAGYWMRPILGDRFPLVLVPLAVLAAAWVGGLVPGLGATAACTLALAYFEVPAAAAVESQVSKMVVLLLLAITGTLISLSVSRLRRDAARARRAETAAEERLGTTDKLYQLSSALSRATSPAEVLAGSLPEITHALGACAGAALLLSADGTVCELSQKVGYPELRTGSAVPFPLGGLSPLNEAVHTRELVVVSSNTLPPVNQRGTIPALNDGDVVLPLMIAGRPVAAILLALNRRMLHDADREFLLAAGRQAAQALARAQSYDTAERGRAEAEALRLQADAALHELQNAEDALRLSETRCRTLAARANRLYAFSAGLSEAVAPDAVAGVIVRHGKLVAGAAAGSVALLSEDRKQLQVLYSEGSGSEAQARRRLPLTRGLCSTAAVATNQPVLVGSFVEWQEKYPESAAIAADGGYVSSATLPLHAADGSVIGVVSFHFTVPVNFDDEYTALLTSVAQHCAQALDRARMYEAAEHARRQAESANRSKDDFLSTISHELRTPLNAILGWAAMLRNGVVDASRTRRALDAIFNNATRQGRLIDELLDVSRIVAGRAAVDLQSVDLGENIRGAVETMMPIAAAKGVEICFKPPSDIEVTADPRRLGQVFLNLLTNAVKFTPADGRITVTVGLSGPHAEVRVVDTGVGIEPAFLPHVFERFRQADSATTRAVGGLGLGLFISRQLVEAQQGTLEAESNGPGTGATFIVTLPAVEASASRWTTEGSPAPPAPEDESLPSLRGVSVLIVDDEPDAVEMMAVALQACGASVVSASSARDALELLERVDVDLLLSDIAMPGEDGCALIRTIRQMSSTHLSTIPAAAVTADARDDERARTLAAGFHMHLSKPIQPAALARAVAALAVSRPT